MSPGLAFGQDIRCPMCHGSGTALGGKLSCNTCHGSGVYRAPEPTPPPAPFEVGMAASQTAADAKWTPLEKLQVRQAILELATTGHPFTADDVWARLPAGFPVTKGLAASLNGAVRRGTIVNTGRTVISERLGEHGHGQRLTVWQGVQSSRGTPPQT